LTDLQAVSQQVADRIVAAVDALNEGVGCFIGVALGYGGVSVKELINSADMAMLRARQSGKEHVAFAL
jgi:GGDEF domain-containing protein